VTLAGLELKRLDVRNRFGGGVSSTNRYSDCSHVVHEMLEKGLGHPIPYGDTDAFAHGRTPSWMIPVPRSEAQPGDVIVQGGHMAIFVGEKNGVPIGAQLGSKGGPSTAPFGLKGYFADPNDLRFYRVNVAALITTQVG